MRILALDIGEVRVGIAISDPAERVATPVCVLPSSEVRACAKSFRRVLDDWEPELLLVGLPLTLCGDEGVQAQRIRDMANEISTTCGIALAFADERLSSKEAKRSMRELGMTEREMRGKIDMIAASLFLQAWLDERAATVVCDAHTEDLNERTERTEDAGRTECTVRTEYTARTEDTGRTEHTA